MAVVAGCMRVSSVSKSLRSTVNWMDMFQARPTSTGCHILSGNVFVLSSRIVLGFPVSLCLAVVATANVFCLPGPSLVVGLQVASHLSWLYSSTPAVP